MSSISRLSNKSLSLDKYNASQLQLAMNATFSVHASRSDRVRISRGSEIYVANKTVFFHPQFKDPKLGPQISLYWQSRMLSFFSQFYSFQLAKPGRGTDKRALAIFHNKHHYLSFLPKHADIHAIDMDYETFSKYQDSVLFWFLFNRPTRLGELYIYSLAHMDLMQSKIFTKIMRKETNDAFDAYYKANNKTKIQQLIKQDMWVSRTDDVLIHVRCQDVLLDEAPNYDMSSVHYMNEAIRNVFGIRLHEHMAVHVVFFVGQMASSSAAKLESYKDGCNEYLFRYLQPALNKTFYPAQIRLITNGSIDDDFYRFIQAPHVICDATSYCWIATVCNEKNAVYVV